MELIRNAEYKRTDLHEFFGGQRQGGISTPANKNVILIFTGDSGHGYGYFDGWNEQGYFLYTGEGQLGDQRFIKGNLAIRDHQENNKKLLLFKYFKSAYVRFEGEMICVDFDYALTPDKNGASRRVIQFWLEHAAAQSSSAATGQRKGKAYRPPTKTERSGLVTSRVGQGYYRQQLLEKFGNRCAVTRTALSEILIASHIVPWAHSDDEARLDVDNGILLSPVYDALFDKCLISFGDEGDIIISKLLLKDDINMLGVNIAAKILVDQGMKKYLSKHRNNLR
jgi:5-methylcytosine-specific restriction protein A